MINLDISRLNLYEDQDNYYFFRALNNGDNEDILNKITFNKKLNKIRTDLDRYKLEAKYSKEDNISLEEVLDHIKENERKDTNCISLSSNACVSLVYGRNYYKDRYVIVKVLKKDLNRQYFLASKYIIENLDKKIERFDLEIEKKYLIEKVYRCNSLEELKGIDENLVLDNSLDEYQNYIINKYNILFKVINKDLLKNFSNEEVLDTLKRAITSSEIIFYKEIGEKYIKMIPSKYMDVLSMFQQINKTSYLENIKETLIKNIFTTFFDDEKILLETKDYQYNASNKDINYLLALSKLKALDTISFLSSLIMDLDFKLISELKGKVFQVNPDIAWIGTGSHCSESVSLRAPLENIVYINKLSEESLKEIIDNG